MSRSSQQSSSSSYMASSTSSASSPPSTAARSSTSHRYSTAHSNSSAFSASANPNEDWTKISDLAERRRIQNRIAQRNYRKKLKRRLEDLEKKAASTESSPEPQPQSAAQPELKYPAPTSQAALPHILDAAAPQPPQIMPTSSAVESIARPSSATSSGYLPPSLDESTIFTPQYRHTYTASPPVMSSFSASTPPMMPGDSPYSQYSPTPSYTGGYAASPPPLQLPADHHQQLPPHFHSPALSSAQSAVSSDGTSIKTEFFDDEVSQFQLNFSPLDNQIGGQFVDCVAPPATAFPHDPTMYAPLAQDFEHTLDPFDSVSPDFWALYPEPPPHFISV